MKKNPKPALPAPKGRHTKAATAAEPQCPATKLGLVVSLLQRPEGASIETLCAATGWQAHSVRGVMSGAVKKKLGHAITSEKAEGVRTYRIVRAAA